VPCPVLHRIAFPVVSEWCQWRQMIEGAAKSSAPEDDNGTKHGTVGSADAILDDLAEHHPTHTVPSPRRESFRRTCRL
jgi:hypothetical protein